MAVRGQLVTGHRLRRLVQGLRSGNGLVLAGIGLLVLGLALSVARLGASPGGASSSLNRSLSQAIQFAQRAILAGDEAMSETQTRFNAVVVAVFLDELSPAQSRTLWTLTAMAGAIGRDLFSLAGLVTLVALGVGYLAVARAFDVRFPGAAPRSGRGRRPDHAPPPSQPAAR